MPIFDIYQPLTVVLLRFEKLGKAIRHCVAATADFLSSIFHTGFEILKLIASRTIPLIDSHSLEERSAREALFRRDDGAFVLYLSDGDRPDDADERLIVLNSRNALLWLNESAETHGSFWH